MRTVPALVLTATLALAGCASGETSETSEPAGITFTGTDEVTWAEPTVTTSAGQTELTIECGDSVNHGLGIEGVADGVELVACEPGGAATTSVDLGAGEYTFFCTVPGHRDAGMVGTLTVS